MDYRNFTAKSVDEAITQACLDLGVTSDRLDYKVVQEASSGFLGLRSKPAIISARARSEEEIQEEIRAAEEAKKAAENLVKKPEKVQEEKKIITSDEIEKRAAAAAEKAKAEGIDLEEIQRQREKNESERRNRDHRRDRGGNGRDRSGAGKRNADRDRRHATVESVETVHHEPSKPKPERVVKERTDEEAAVLTNAASEFLKSVFGAMNIEAEIKVEYDKKEGAVSCIFNGEEMGLLIGKRGQTLDSLQYLTSLVVNRCTDEYVRVKLDTEDYRSRRSDTLNNLARNIAYKVKKTRRPVALEPMNPYERRIIHSALQGNKFVETYSEGEEPYRHVVVAPKRS